MTLLDAMLGISILMLAITYMVPQLSTVYNERIAVQEKSFAIDTCHYMLQNWILSHNNMDSTTLTGPNGTKYHVRWSSRESSTVELCLDWTGANGRSQSICGEAK
ncbi:hypothetical protein [Pseudalkalibacillus berkeleyi]|uniref:Type II secretion system protein n=1 Tax=Pseudalkalibacillus berkeleyi TaxID=1069813 RepID=A0ABS9H228_9BACL|nr:hypothetical protein [Pseudalkalibacillus berkeleyi]MCF6137885.1 hypothetical protein [Pseudalkalibacillus berkeleyi]